MQPLYKIRLRYRHICLKSLFVPGERTRVSLQSRLQLLPLAHISREISGCVRLNGLLCHRRFAAARQTNSNHQR